MKLQQDVPVPEHLRNPSALDPVPLSLNLGLPPFERQEDGRIFKTDVLAAARNLHREDREAIEDLHVLDLLVGSYRAIFRENPVAPGNRQVVEALTGRNPYKLVFIDPTHPAIGPTGELVDRWGTPYRFHPISGTRMEFSSAGKDRHVGTADDVHLMRPDLEGDSGAGS
ncbi:MAG: hypothetical protein HKO57_05230 [Akkermansiaceae bacterium]|nr:hypothetical protein [Akkermansiaceae bacterium]